MKERALFVLAQSGSAQARQMVAEIARGKSNPGLQEKAIKYLGLFGGDQSRQALAEIYARSLFELAEAHGGREAIEACMREAFAALPA